MEFVVLGPVTITADGQSVPAGHARQRAVLAVLLLELGRVVSAELLIDRVWGDDPPASVRNVLYGYITRLKSVLASAPGPAVKLVRRPGGYQLQAEPGQVDLCRFRALVAEASTAADDDARAGESLRAGLGLWQGPALAGLASPWLDAMRQRLELERAAAVLDLNDIRLRHGEHSTLVAELTGQAAATPTDERLIGQLMLALYRSGQQADALRWFEQTRLQLADELGADPGVSLRALHAQILRGDPSLTLQADASTRSAPPRQLPAAVGGFTGRACELAALTRLLTRTDGAMATMVVSAIGGTAGVGKTALAVHWAHQVADRFPDGQLYVNLRGYDPDQPMPATDALAGFLRALGSRGQDIPAEIEERAARYRSLLADKQMLVVLDNAGSVQQVRPLLPGSPGCAVLVTSRDSLAGLVARDGAGRVDLDLLPTDEAVSLLSTLIGDRVHADPVTAERLAESCARLPLALRVAAELAVSRPAASLAELLDEFDDRQPRLDHLQASGDARTEVREVFSWSYRGLEEGPARAFRLTGLHPGPDLDAYALAALTDGAMDTAGRDLEALTRANLIQPAGPGRYGMHDLLREYAAELAATQDGDDGGQAALTRLFDHYLYGAATAMDTLYPAQRHRRPRIPAPATPAVALADAAAARCWLDTEEPNLVAVGVIGADRGWPSHATRLAATLFRYLQDASSPHEITIHTAALRAARRIGDSAAEAAARTGLGAANWRLGRYDDAVGNYERALTLFRGTGDLAGQARVLHNLGMVSFDQASYAQAAEYSRLALDLFRQTVDRTGEAGALTSLGNAVRHRGDNQQAAEHFQHALRLYRETGYHNGEAVALGNLGVIAQDQGHYQRAAALHSEALAIFREIGDRRDEANALNYLGVAARLGGQYAQAVSYHRQAVALFRSIGSPAREAAPLIGIGEAFLAAGQLVDARKQLETALVAAQQHGNRFEEARGYDLLGQVQHAAGCPDEARRHWRQALRLYAAFGACEADRVRAQLAELNGAVVSPAGAGSAVRYKT
jgi:DNA-binding SARP family transcriptional activator/Tfp pilus assembly protein PilF